jgi:TPP-dependent pyruvate/acetoin dehydrogenase alpha subunit
VRPAGRGSAFHTYDRLLALWTMTGSAAATELVDLYERMTVIRTFETRVGELYRATEIPGFVHTSLGQEAVPVGVCSALRRDDYVAATHRGHGQILAKGADPHAAMAELFGKATGLCGGKGGSMHIADPALGILGANGIVGAGLPLAAGAAMSSRMRGLDNVAVAFFGDGAANTGVFHETVNLSCVWSLPVLFVCENNGFTEFSRTSDGSRRERVAETAPAYRIDAHEVDGDDVEAVLAVAADAVARCRAGEGPVLIEAHTARWHGHYEGDAQDYRAADELSQSRDRDPLGVVRSRLGPDYTARLDEIDRAALRLVDDAEAAARAAPDPRPEEAFADVFAG